MAWSGLGPLHLEKREPGESCKEKRVWRSPTSCFPGVPGFRNMGCPVSLLAFNSRAHNCLASYKGLTYPALPPCLPCPRPSIPGGKAHHTFAHTDPCLSKASPSAKCPCVLFLQFLASVPLGCEPPTLEPSLHSTHFSSNGPIFGRACRYLAHVLSSALDGDPWGIGAISMFFPRKDVAQSRGSVGVG